MAYYLGFCKSPNSVDLRDVTWFQGSLLNVESGVRINGFGATWIPECVLYWYIKGGWSLLVFHFNERCGMAEPVEGFFSPSEVQCPFYPWGRVYGYLSKMGKCGDNIRGLLKSASGIDVSQVHEADDHHHQLINFIGSDNVVSQTRQ